MSRPARRGTCRKRRLRTLAAVARVYRLNPKRDGARWIALCPACGAQTLTICATRGAVARWECPCGVAGNCPSELQRLAEGRPVTPKPDRLRDALAIVATACDRHGPTAQAWFAALVSVLARPAAPDFSAAVDGGDA